MAGRSRDVDLARHALAVRQHQPRRLAAGHLITGVVHEIRLGGRQTHHQDLGAVEQEHRGSAGVGVNVKRHEPRRRVQHLIDPLRPRVIGSGLRDKEGPARRPAADQGQRGARLALPDTETPPCRSSSYHPHRPPPDSVSVGNTGFRRVSLVEHILRARFG